MKGEKNILVIDDDSGIGEMLKILLELNEYSVFVSENPDEAETLIEKNSIDLVLLDKLISGVNGVEVCERLKNNEATAHIPILMMSALHEAGEKCRNAGANDFIAKPFDMDELLEKIRGLLDQEPQ